MTLLNALRNYDAVMCHRCAHERGEHEPPIFDDDEYSCEDHGQCNECDCPAFVDPELYAADVDAGGMPK